MSVGKISMSPTGRLQRCPCGYPGAFQIITTLVAASQSDLLQPECFFTKCQRFLQSSSCSVAAGQAAHAPERIGVLGRRKRVEQLGEWGPVSETESVSEAETGTEPEPVADEL